VTRLVLAVRAVPLLAAAPATAANPWRQPGRPWNIAHQGGEDEFPSNTLYAFKRARAAGADMLELDIGVTRDNRIVVSHDTTVDRTTDGHGTIASQTLRAVRRLDAAYWFAPHRAAPYRHGRRADGRDIDYLLHANPRLQSWRSQLSQAEASRFPSKRNPASLTPLNIESS
jgi:glycerophosphoryl diester phosphodiesterase